MNNSVGKLHQSAFFFPLGRAFITEVCVPSIVKIVTGIFEMSTYRAKEHTRAREHTHTNTHTHAHKHTSYTRTHARTHRLPSPLTKATNTTAKYKK